MLFWILLGVAALLLLFTAVISLLTFRFAFVRGAKQPDPDASHELWGPYIERISAAKLWIQQQHPEEVSIVSGDGLTLRGLFVPAENAMGTVLLMHGYRGSGLNDFSYLFSFYHERGYHLLVPDQRAHGRSDGRYITFGVQERFDCRLWVQYLCGRFGEQLPLVLHGVSMGAATVMMASALSLPANVKCLIADCGYTSPIDEYRYVLKQHFHLFPGAILAIERLLCRKIAHFDFRSVSALEAMKHDTLPVLFLHGSADTFVPTVMSRENYEACTGEKELLIIDGAIHGISYLYREDLCAPRLSAFLQKHVGAPLHQPR